MNYQIKQIKIPREWIKEDMKLAMFTSVILSAHHLGIWLTTDDLEKYVHYKRWEISKIKIKFKEKKNEIDFTKMSYTYIQPSIVFNIMNRYEFKAYLGIMYFYNQRNKSASVSINKLSKLTQLNKTNLRMGLNLLQQHGILKILWKNGHKIYKIFVPKMEKKREKNV